MWIVRVIALLAVLLLAAVGEAASPPPDRIAPTKPTVDGARTTSTNASVATNRAMTLHAYFDGGASDGDLVIRELINKAHVTLSGPLFKRSCCPSMIRGGTCARRARGRAIRAHGSSEADVSFDRLRAATFAVESFSDGWRVACADHRGPHDLRTDVKPVKLAGRARHLGGRIVVSHPALSLLLTPTAGGRKTALHVKMFGEGNGDGFFRLRHGSCAVVGAGLELPFDVVGGGDGEPSFLDAIVPIPFASFGAGGWVAEDDSSDGGASICISL